MDRGEVYQIAKDRVKISHFTEKGHDLKGVVHIGTNDGYEIEWYLMMGLKVIGFEPLPEAYVKCCTKYAQAIHDGRLKMFNYAIGGENDDRLIRETRGDDGGTGGSSFLEDVTPSEHVTISTMQVRVRRWATVVLSLVGQVNWEDYDTLVMDVQGMELEVLKSMDVHTEAFKFLNIECSEVPIYHGEAPAAEVVQYLHNMGFRQDSPTEPHNDIMFIRDGI